MKKLLNTLFVTTDGAYIRKKHETLVVEIERKPVLRLPLVSICNINCFGRVNMSPSFMHHCAGLGIGIAFFNTYGRFLARVQGPKSGNVLLRRQQYRLADDLEHSADIARFIIAAKVANSRSVLKRAIRNNPDNAEAKALETATRELSSCMKNLAKTIHLDSLRGIEGGAASSYFNVFNHLIIKQKDGFAFRERNRRPPKDTVNAMLSFVYSVMLQDCVSALEGVGLDPYVGFLHRDRPGRQSLALDLEEEFRSVLADRLVLSMINLKQVKASEFTMSENGAVLLGDKLIKKILTEYHNRKQKEVLHPVIKERLQIGLLFHVQASLLARHIRGDMDYYPAYIWR